MLWGDLTNVSDIAGTINSYTNSNNDVDGVNHVRGRKMVGANWGRLDGSVNWYSLSDMKPNGIYQLMPPWTTFSMIPPDAVNYP